MLSRLLPSFRGLRTIFLTILVLLSTSISLHAQSSQRVKPQGDLIARPVKVGDLKPHHFDDTTYSNKPISPVETVIPPVEPVTSLIAQDHKYDNGNAIELSWVPSVDDKLVGGRILSYSVLRTEGEMPQVEVAKLPSGSNSYLDNTVEKGRTYRYQVMALADRAGAVSITTQEISPQAELFDFSKIGLLILLLCMSGAILLFIRKATYGKPLFVRKVAGLEAVDEAVGRATEMGRPILFVPGTLDLNEVETIAAITIFGRVAKKIAECDSRLFMPVSRSLVMTASREAIQAAYLEAGREDSYHDDLVIYVTDEQFGYTAAVDGYMVREKPAAIFLLGAFYGESLILAEMGNSIGAIQVAGTARAIQIPFFVAACDYTLIGEELFAASAYLSGEPRQLGSLKGQDLGKVLAIAAILIGVFAATLVAVGGENSIGHSILNSLRLLFGSEG